MRFITKSIKEIDRHTEQIGKVKQEEITLEIHLINSGDTRDFTSDQVISRIMEKIDIINK